MELFRSRTRRKIAAVMAVITAAASVPFSSSMPVTAAVTDSAGDYNYAKALQYSIYFYDANMCGTEVGEHTRLSWRDDCHT